MIPNKFSGLSILLILALLISSFAVVMPAAPVKADVTAVTISLVYSASDTSNTGPAVVSPNGTVTVRFSFSGSGTYTYKAFMQQGSSTAFQGNGSSGAAGATLYDTIILGSAAAGYYNVWVSVNGVLSPTSTNAVYVDTVSPTVSIITPNSGTCWKSGTSQNVQFSLSEISTVTATISYDGSSWAPLITSTSYPQGPSTVTTTPGSSVNSSLCYVKFDSITDKAGNVTSNTVSSPFSSLNAVLTPTISTPGAASGEVYNGGSSTTITGTINAPAGSTVSYILGLWTDGVNTENITAGWQTVSMGAVSTYAVSKTWTVSNTVKSSNCLVGMWVKDCAGNVSSPGFSSNAFRIKDVTQPTVSILWPLASTVHYIGATDNVTWTQTDNVAGNLNYIIYLSTNGGTTWSSVIATGSAAQGTQSVVWVIPAIAPSTTCKLCENVTDSENPANVRTVLSGVFSIVAGQQPVVTVSSPASSVSWAVGSTQSIAWTASDASSTSARLNYLVELTADGGTNYRTIANLTNQAQGSNTYSWAVANPHDLYSGWPSPTGAVPSSNCKVRVTATNPASLQSGTNVSSNTFSITVASFPVTTATVTLYPGWNLVSLPLIPTNTNIQNILGSSISSITSVWTCSGGGSSGGTWTYYAPGATSSLSTMVDGKAYWIQTNITSGTVSFAFQGRMGNPPPSSPPTYTFSTPGWYMVGYKSTSSSHTLEDYAGSNTSGGTKIYTIPATGFDPVIQAYTTVTSATTLDPGYGYWIYYNSAGAITPPSD
jgi:hypothetical protein